MSDSTDIDGRLEKAKTFHLYNVQLVFKNFSGKKARENPNGLRGFGVIVPDDIAEQMAADGWKVKEINGVGKFIAVWIPATWPQDMSHYDHEDLGLVHMTVEGFRWFLNNKTGVKPFLVQLRVPKES